MQKFEIPYGHGKMPVSIPDSCKATVVTASANAADSSVSETELVRRAMEKPIGSETLFELARGKKNAVILISDHTRPVPSRVILPLMLRELRRAEPEIDVTLLVATGCHRGTTEAELRAKLGDEIFSREKIAVHDCDESETKYLGDMPSGAPCIINALAANTELLIAEGFIEPHFFAGFSGGRKSVMPGISNRSTVLGNHCAEFIASPFARTGILESNPIHRDMTAAARMAKVQYIVNVVIDSEKRVTAAFAGDVIAAHEAGCAYLKDRCAVPALDSDIVITGNGGEPFDQNIYQCVKCMSAAEAMAHEKGAMIVCANCSDGIGGEMFFRALSECESIEALEREVLETPMTATKPDQWQYQILCRIMKTHRVIFVTRPELRETVEAMKLEYAESADEALRLALKEHGESAKIAVMPNGIEIMVVRS